MMMEIKNENYNRFLKRKELRLDAEHPEESTPSAAAIKQFIAKQTNAQAEKIEIKEIVSSRGAPTTKCTVFVWDEKIVKEPVKKEKKEAAPAK